MATAAPGARRGVGAFAAGLLGWPGRGIRRLWRWSLDSSHLYRWVRGLLARSVSPPAAALCSCLCAVLGFAGARHPAGPRVSALRLRRRPPRGWPACWRCAARRRCASPARSLPRLTAGRAGLGGHRRRNPGVRRQRHAGGVVDGARATGGRVSVEPTDTFLACAPGEPGHGAGRDGGHPARAVPSSPAWRVGRTDPLGLLSTRRTARQPDRIVLAYPRFFTLDRLPLPVGRRYQPGGIPLASSLGDSIEFVGTREYREGDPLRRIHWRSWARRGSPVVKEYQEEYFSRVALVLDTFLPRRARPADRRRFEAGISVLASIADHFSRSEEVVDIFAAGSGHLRGERGPEPGLPRERAGRPRLSRALPRATVRDRGRPVFTRPSGSSPRWWRSSWIGTRPGSLPPRDPGPGAWRCGSSSCTRGPPAAPGKRRRGSSGKSPSSSRTRWSGGSPRGVDVSAPSTRAAAPHGNRGGGPLGPAPGPDRRARGLRGGPGRPLRSPAAPPPGHRPRPAVASSPEVAGLAPSGGGPDGPAGGLRLRRVVAAAPVRPATTWATPGAGLLGWVLAVLAVVFILGHRIWPVAATLLPTIVGILAVERPGPGRDPAVSRGLRRGRARAVGLRLRAGRARAVSACRWAAFLVASGLLSAGAVRFLPWAQPHVERVVAAHLRGGDHRAGGAVAARRVRVAGVVPPRGPPGVDPGAPPAPGLRPHPLRRPGVDLVEVDSGGPPPRRRSSRFGPRRGRGWRECRAGRSSSLRPSGCPPAGRGLVETRVLQSAVKDWPLLLPASPVLVRAPTSQLFRSPRRGAALASLRARTALRRGARRGERRRREARRRDWPPEPRPSACPGDWTPGSGCWRPRWPATLDRGRLDSRTRSTGCGLSTPTPSRWGASRPPIPSRSSCSRRRRGTASTSRRRRRCCCACRASRRGT